MHGQNHIKFVLDWLWPYIWWLRYRYSIPGSDNGFLYCLKYPKRFWDPVSLSSGHWGVKRPVRDLDHRTASIVEVRMRGNTGCPRRNVPDFGRVFLLLKYTDITQNTCVQSWTVTEIMAREKCGLLACPHTVPVSWQHYPCPSLSVVSYYGISAHTSSKLFMYFLLGDKAVRVSAWHSCHV